MMAKLERSPQQARMEAVSRDALVQAALQEITQNYREASLSNVARAYGVSLAYVSECVRAQTGRTYKELLQKHRMETAARLLRRSDLNIQQIIAQVGYENTSYFYRLFHERYGLSPREYRLVRVPKCPAARCAWATRRRCPGWAPGPVRLPGSRGRAWDAAQTGRSGWPGRARSHRCRCPAQSHTGPTTPPRPTLRTIRP